jgi:hypothetical protein
VSFRHGGPRNRVYVNVQVASAAQA